MSVTELERALRSLRLSGMIATLEARALQVAHHDMDFIEAFSCLVQDDGDCPFCARYVRYTRLTDAAGPVRLLNLRVAEAERREFSDRGLNPDKGMIVRYRDRLYGGADAMSLLAALTTPATAFNRLSAWAFRSSARARVLYPLLRAGRSAVLLLLGRTGLQTPAGWSRTPYGFFLFAFGVFGVLHFATYAFRFLTPLYPTTYVIGLAGLLLALFPLSRRAFVLLVAALAVDGVLQAPRADRVALTRRLTPP